MKLYLRIDKIESREVASEEIQVPIKREILEEIKEVAESVRKREIPKLRKIKKKRDIYKSRYGSKQFDNIWTCAIPEVGA